jgi:predicted RNA-binding Zn ribbon-like protein
MAVNERFGPTRRGGPMFRWLGEPLAVDLANTVMVVRPGEAVDLLESPEQLRMWLAAEGERVAGVALDPARDLTAVRDLRGAVRALLEAAARGEELPPAALEVVNATSAAAPIAPRLVVAADGSREVEPPSPDSIDALLGAVAHSAIGLLASMPEGQIRVCNAPSCGMLYLGSRRWCCGACGNRARAARHYARRRASRTAGARPDPQ